MRHLRYLLEAIPLYLAFAVFWALPLDAASALGGFLFRALGPRLALSRRARRRITEILPEADADAVLRKMWDNLGRTFAEYPHLEKIIKDGRVAIEGEAHVAAAKAKGPVLFATGHFANWEVVAFAGSALAQQMDLDLAIIFRTPNNPYAARLLAWARRGWRAIGFAKGREGAIGLYQHVRRGGAAALLVDQRLNDGVEALFFDRPAMTSPAIAELALRCGAALVPAYCERLQGAHFRVVAEAPLSLPDFADGVPQAQKVDAILRLVHQRLEDWIRARPAQWLWLHDRWERKVKR